VTWERAVMLRADAAGRWLDATDEALEMFGVPSLDVLRGLPNDAFSATAPDPAERDALIEAYGAAFAQGVLIEGPYRTLDGEVGRARTAVFPDPDGAYSLVVYPIERPTTNLSTRVVTIADVLAEWRSAERKLVALDAASDEARRVTEEIAGLREAHRRLFRKASGGVD
jgi:PAS domain-containing protein